MILRAWSKSVELVDIHIEFSHQQLLHEVAEHGRTAHCKKGVFYFCRYSLPDLFLIHKSNEAIPAFSYGSIDWKMALKWLILPFEIFELSLHKYIIFGSVGEEQSYLWTILFLLNFSNVLDDLEEGSDASSTPEQIKVFYFLAID